MKITLLDYGAGNVASVERALQRLGTESSRGATPEAIFNASAIILPGVGHYAALIRALDEQKLRTPLLEKLSSGVPFLGICLGLQALYETSDEAPDLAGLHVLNGRVTELPANVKLPHMGWNQVQCKAASRLLDGIPANSYFYFAHSYAATQANGEAVAVCNYGAEFAAIIEQRNLFAVQFHPEKSGVPGARILENFLRLAA
jgi:imidazole glycerol phosphate synthase glutamine amidotransferase subunit